MLDEIVEIHDHELRSWERFIDLSGEQRLVVLEAVDALKGLEDPQVLRRDKNFHGAAPLP
jgi:hypothetical protein